MRLAFKASNLIIYVLVGVFLYLFLSLSNIHIFDGSKKNEINQKKLLIYEIQNHLKEYKTNCLKYPVTNNWIDELKNKKCLNSNSIDELLQSKYINELRYESDSRSYNIRLKLDNSEIVVNDKDDD